ncbi:2-C-methyl-D-erythritol 4-phosphate cytidylyltransferase [bacterium]|nr:2-C-methyl-D-erythritol 4-phosphate cytidylyltransferase [bacterium]
MKTGAVIVAGGRGTRMGSDTPKQLLNLGGIPILERTLRPFINSPEINCIVIVAEKSIFEHIRGFIGTTLPVNKPVMVVQGGPERQDSVLNGIQALDEDTDIVVIHDAVRPFITEDLISACIHGAESYGAVSVMRPLKETVKVVQDGMVVKTPDRSTLRITQTPQAFRKELITEAHAQAGEDGFIGTDDCMLAERMGIPVYIIEGNDMNIKITTPADLVIAEAMLKLFENGGISC